MSNSESLPAGDGEQPPPTVIPSETEDPPATPDPLLGSGSFIDPNNGGDQSASKEAAAENSTSSDPLLQKYSRPSWLPEDWNMILKKRTSGATEGTVDRYYISPTGRRLRSKNEVLTFLETGSKRKKPSTPSSDDATSNSATPKTKKAATPKTKKEAAPQAKKTDAPPTTKKKTSARKKVHAVFDFKNPPEKVSWCLSYATEDVWSPKIGDWTIPLATKQEWASVFSKVCQN
ncbi:hypothetical protein SSX86_021764 [Deinandra increscens subsp. villosa]|uniref:MBD domain-containing protein n=1 Tax=Deinandra increscens subsp. villosa TaxID=3103831 RepID=A0AAP0GU48_9ASTR